MARGIVAYAGVAKDQSDLGAVAILNELAWFPLLCIVQETASNAVIENK